MNFFEIVKKRYSHRGNYLAETVPLADLERIAEAGLAAPTGMNWQCVRLIILPDKAALQPLLQAVPTERLSTAPTAIAVLTDSFTQDEKKNFEMEDYSAAVENMLLAAVALELASLWLDSPYFDGKAQKAALEALGIPAGYRLRAVLPIGKPEVLGTPREKLPFSERVSYVRFGGVKST
ncbi:MAG: nitroreductase family protein [Oscillospiraceae bacterium]|nr:nitroreductase family protein [Oscillospiraceae bacterium]